jgi:hypothetical protein
MIKLDCANCFDKDDCSEYKYTSVRDVSVRCGLICHSDAREYMMQDVLRKLEDYRNECTGFPEEEIYEKIIDMIRGEK